MRWAHEEKNAARAAHNRAGLIVRFCKCGIRRTIACMGSGTLKRVSGALFQGALLETTRGPLLAPSQFRHRKSGIKSSARLKNAPGDHAV
jgi:hypothetical protein